MKTLWISVKSIANETARAEAFKQGLVTMADSGKYPSDFASTLRELSQGIEKVSDYSKNASIVSYYSSVLNKRAIRLTMKDGRHRALFIAINFLVGQFAGLKKSKEYFCKVPKNRIEAKD